MFKVLVVYVSFTGKTQRLAKVLAEGAKEAGAEVTLKRAGEVMVTDLYAADGVAFGTPNPFGSMAGNMKGLFERVWGESFAGRLMVAFVVPSRGGTKTLEGVETFAARLGFEKASSGVVAPRDEVKTFEKACRQLGNSLVAALEARTEG
jgi:multimeric flavodoxin WrbA